MSGVGKGGTYGAPPPPPKPKKVVEKWCSSKGTLREEAEIQEICRKNYEKRQFSIEILIKKSQNFLELFQNYLRFWSTHAKNFEHMLLNFPCLMEFTKC